MTTREKVHKTIDLADTLFLILAVLGVGFTVVMVIYALFLVF